MGMDQNRLHNRVNLGDALTKSGNLSAAPEARTKQNTIMRRHMNAAEPHMWHDRDAYVARCHYTIKDRRIYKKLNIRLETFNLA